VAASGSLATWNYPGRMFRRASPLRAAVVILFCGALLAGCGDDSASRDSGVADVYIVVVEWVLAESEFALDPALDEKSPVFVDSLGPGEIDLDVQVEVVRHFEPVVDIRFVDIRTEALDEFEVGAPVRDGGLLLGLGVVPVEGPIDIRAEVYKTSDRVVGYRFRLVRSGQTVVLIEQPEPVEPESLVGEP